MENLRSIGLEYIEYAKRIGKSTQIIGISLSIVILFSWLTNEYLFDKIKFDSIILYVDSYEIN